MTKQETGKILAVIAGSFKRSWRARKEAEKSLGCVPRLRIGERKS